MRKFRDLIILCLSLLVIGYVMMPSVNEELQSAQDSEQQTGETVLEEADGEEVMIERKINVGCIGDSITEGTEGVNYPDILQELLGDDYVVMNFGVEGTTASEDSQMSYRDQDRFSESMNAALDITVIMFGTNDSNTLTWKDQDSFYAEYTSLVETYVNQFPDAMIYLCTIPTAYYLDGKTSGVAEYDIQPENYTMINETINQVADDFQLEVIDINSVTADHFSWFSGDGIHPDSDGMNAIATEIYNHILGIE